MRRLSLLLVVALFLGACDEAASSVESATPPGQTTTIPAEGPVAPSTPTSVPEDCGLLADAYVDTARQFFDGTPDDVATESARSRFAEIDQIALAGGCGDAYRRAVCTGLDELTLSGTLVIYPLVTAKCI